MEIIKIIAVAIIGAGAISLIKKNNQEFVIPIEMATIGITLFLILNYISGIVEYIEGIVSAYGIESGYVMIILKALCIAIIVEIGANICKDSGSTAIASKIELAGKVAILFLSLPLLEKLAEFAIGLING